MTNKLGIIGGSGLYDIEEFKDKEELEINTPWGKPSDKIYKINYDNKEVYFIPWDKIYLFIIIIYFINFV